MDTGAGLKAMRAQRETADAAVWAKRGVDGDDRTVWMRTTDFCEEVCKIQSVNRAVLRCRKQAAGSGRAAAENR